MRNARYMAVTALMAGAVAFCAGLRGEGVAPQAGLVVPCEVIEWHDGDTGTVRVTLDIRVRLLDCWAPEIHGRTLTADEKKLPASKQAEVLKQIAAEKQRGVDSLRSVSQIAPIGSRGQLEIPFAGAERSDDLFTLGRVLGRVWVGGKDVSALQVAGGFATKGRSE